LLGSKVPDFTPPVMPDADREILEGINTAFDYYKLFQPDSFVQDVIVQQSKLYALQKNLRADVSRSMTKDNYRCMEAILLLGGYAGLPRRRMLWEDKPDCRNQLVVDAIRRDDMDNVMRCLHFRDNLLLDDDGYYKVRPLFDNLNSNSLRWFGDQQYYSVNEVMVPYYGKHSSKQFIQGKPIRHGFKVISEQKKNALPYSKTFCFLFRPGEPAHMMANFFVFLDLGKLHI